MKAYAFAMPILSGKTEVLRKYLRELSSRKEEYDRSCQRLGIRTEQIWIQRAPQGKGPDLLITMWDTDDPMYIFKHGFESKDSFEQFFKDKIFVECLGMDVTQLDPNQMPPLNEHIVDHTPPAVKEKQQVQAGKS